jgi:hypothetical protein
LPYAAPHYPFQSLRHPGYDISGTMVEGSPESQFSDWHAPLWHPVLGKACGDVVTDSELNAVGEVNGMTTSDQALFREMTTLADRLSADVGH